MIVDECSLVLNAGKLKRLIIEIGLTFTGIDRKYSLTCCDDDAAILGMSISRSSQVVISIFATLFVFEETVVLLGLRAAGL